MVKLILFTFQPCCTEYLYSNLFAIEQDCLIFVLNAKLTAGQIALCNGNLSADLLRISRPGKFQPTGSSYHADESIQLQKTEPLRLHYSSFQRLWHLQLVTSGFMASTRSEQHLPGRDALINAYAQPGACPGLCATFWLCIMSAALGNTSKLYRPRLHDISARPNHLPLRRKQAFRTAGVWNTPRCHSCRHNNRNLSNAMLSYVVSVVVNNNPRSRQAFSKRPFLLAIS